MKEQSDLLMYKELYEKYYRKMFYYKCLAKDLSDTFESYIDECCHSAVDPDENIKYLIEKGQMP